MNIIYLVSFHWRVEMAAIAPRNDGPKAQIPLKNLFSPTVVSFFIFRYTLFPMPSKVGFAILGAGIFAREGEFGQMKANDRTSACHSFIWIV